MRLYLFSFSNSHKIGPKISLESSSYFVTESDGSVTVCAVVNGGSLSSSVEVTIVTQSSTASCEMPYKNISITYMYEKGREE